MEWFGLTNILPCRSQHVILLHTGSQLVKVLSIFFCSGPLVGVKMQFPQSRAAGSAGEIPRVDSRQVPWGAQGPATILVLKVPPIRPFVDGPLIGRQFNCWA